MTTKELLDKIAALPDLDDTTPVINESRQAALAFASALPSWALVDWLDVYCDTDGSVSFDWMGSNAQGVLFVSAEPDMRLTFAVLAGQAAWHGAPTWDGKSIPTEIMDALRAVLGVKETGR